MDLQTRLVDGFRQRQAYIEQLKQAIGGEEWVKVSRLSSELATLDLAIKYAEDIIDSK